ncbi:MAG: ATP synthase F0 subunit B [Desulfuromonadales bacterium]|nr:ATP synthase F0 subunit B [Desulfuromonadales bacterium]
MIDINLSFVFQLVGFLLLILILNIFLYKPIRKILAERSDELLSAKERAEVVDQEIQAKMAEYEARLRDMKSNTTDERGQLTKEAQAEENAILELARKEATDSINTIKTRISAEVSDARVILQEQARSLSKDICEKVLGRSL